MNFEAGWFENYYIRNKDSAVKSVLLFRFLVLIYGLCCTNTLLAQTATELIYSIDTGYHQAPEVVRHQIYLKNQGVLPILQVEQNIEDFEFIGTIGLGDSITFIFNNYNSPVGISRYYLIQPVPNKLYKVDFAEFESAFLDSVDLQTKLVYYTDFQSECGVFKKKELTLIENSDFVINDYGITVLKYYFK